MAPYLIFTHPTVKKRDSCHFCLILLGSRRGTSPDLISHVQHMDERMFIFITFTYAYMCVYDYVPMHVGAWGGQRC